MLANFQIRSYFLGWEIDDYVSIIDQIVVFDQKLRNWVTLLTEKLENPLEKWKNLKSLEKPSSYIL